MSEETNALAQIGSLGAMLPKSLTPHERKIFTAMSDLSKGHKRISVDPVFANKMYATMATQTYRIAVEPNGRVNITTWGLAEDIDRSYDSVDELPQWMQRKIAVLMIFDPEKPMDEIKGIGRRISRATFWVYPDEGEDDGNDTRTPCEDTGT
jgi:hypothetical protein